MSLPISWIKKIFRHRIVILSLPVAPFVKNRKVVIITNKQYYNTLIKSNKTRTVKIDMNFI